MDSCADIFLHVWKFVSEANMVQQNSKCFSFNCSIFGTLATLINFIIKKPLSKYKSAWLGYVSTIREIYCKLFLLICLHLDAKKHVTVVSQISADEYNVKMSMLHFGVHEWICLTYIKHILIKIVAILG